MASAKARPAWAGQRIFQRHRSSGGHAHELAKLRLGEEPGVDLCHQACGKCGGVLAQSQMLGEGLDALERELWILSRDSGIGCQGQPAAAFRIGIDPVASKNRQP